MQRRSTIPARSVLAGLLVLALAAGTAQAAPEGAQDGRADSHERGASRGERAAPGGDRAGPRDERAAAQEHRFAPGGDRGAPGSHRGFPRPGEPPRWFDGAHGHAHSYPTPGWRVRSLPPRTRIVFWGGINYGFFDGIWYAPGPGGYIVARPPYGIVVSDLPAFRTVVLIGGIAYLYANGVYYREIAEGGYEVVPPPVAGDSVVGTSNARVFVYPRQGQSAERQATDEYECHAWAVTQSGFDPTSAATGQSAGSPDARRGDYQRARGACLEGRGYTVR